MRYIGDVVVGAVASMHERHSTWRRRQWIFGFGVFLAICCCCGSLAYAIVEQGGLVALVSRGKIIL